MKILQIRSEFRDNGPGSQALTLARELRTRGHEVAFAASGGELHQEITDDGFTFHEIPSLAVTKRNLIDVMHSILALRRVLRLERPEIVHGHNAASIMMAYMAALSTMYSAKYVQSVRGIELRDTHQWRNWIYRISPAELLAVSEFTRDQLVNIGAKPSRIHITYNGVDLSRFDPVAVTGKKIREEFRLGDGIVTGHVGNFSGWKGQELLVRAAAALREEFPSARWVLVGKGPAHEEVKALASTLGVSDIVVFPGFRRDIPEFQAAFDLYSQPSTQGEMFPNAIVEAMAMQNCWVGSDISGLAELADEGRTGLLVEPGDLDGLITAFRSHFADPDAIRNRGLAARKLVEAKLTVNQVVDRVVRVYLNSN